MPNPFAGSRGYARLSNLLMQPLYRLLPVPRGFALLTVIGRRSGRRLRRPVRAIRSDNTLYAVAKLGERSDWLRNVRKEPQVEIKVGDERYGAMAREALARLDVDELGLDEVDHKVLRTIIEKFDGGPVGIEAPKQAQVGLWE